VREAVSGWDAIVSHWALPGAIVAGALRGERPHLAVMHSADLHLLSKLPGRAWIAERIARAATAMLFVSTRHRDAFVSWLPSGAQLEASGKSHVSPMGVDGEAIGEGRPSAAERKRVRAALGANRFTLLSMGRLVAVKGIADAIDAVAGMSDVELVIAGEGPEKDALVRRAVERRARVRFVGVISGERKRAWLAAADAFVAPSRVMASGRTEGMPHAVIEAIAVGLPVIASDVGGIGTVIRDGREGLLVAAGDAGALRDAIARVAHDRALGRRMSRSGIATARGLDWADIAPRIEELLCE
jgi:glycosyltransferase involved in cell wall biosynthesis